jgi:hypothetical protein
MANNDLAQPQIVPAVAERELNRNELRLLFSIKVTSALSAYLGITFSNDSTKLIVQKLLVRFSDIEFDGFNTLDLMKLFIYFRSEIDNSLADIEGSLTQIPEIQQSIERQKADDPSYEFKFNIQLFLGYLRGELQRSEFNTEYINSLNEAQITRLFNSLKVTKRSLGGIGGTRIECDDVVYGIRRYYDIRGLSKGESEALLQVILKRYMHLHHKVRIDDLQNDFVIGYETDGVVSTDTIVVLRQCEADADLFLLPRGLAGDDFVRNLNGYLGKLDARDADKAKKRFDAEVNLLEGLINRFLTDDLFQKPFIHEDDPSRSSKSKEEWDKFGDDYYPLLQWFNVGVGAWNNSVDINQLRSFKFWLAKNKDRLTTQLRLLIGYVKSSFSIGPDNKLIFSIDNEFYQLPEDLRELYKDFIKFIFAENSPYFYIDSDGKVHDFLRI